MRTFKILVIAGIVVALLSGVMAFKSRNTTFYKLDSNGNCREQFLGRIYASAPVMHYNTEPNDGACPLTDNITPDE